MSQNDVPVKTEAGEREIETRAHKLNWQTRALLVSIRGNKTMSELGYLFKTPAEMPTAFQRLTSEGLIQILPHDVELPALADGDGVSSMQQARQLLNETAVGSLGVLGGISAFRFTLKLERCYSADEVRAIYPDYRHLVTKKRGDEFVDAVLHRVDELLAEQA